MSTKSNSNRQIDYIEILTFVSLSVSTREFMNNALSLDDFDEWTSRNGKTKYIFGHYGDKNIDKRKNKNIQLEAGPL